MTSYNWPLIKIQVTQLKMSLKCRHFTRIVHIVSVYVHCQWLLLLVELVLMVQLILCSPWSCTINGPAWPGPSRSTISSRAGNGSLLHRLTFLCSITGRWSFTSNKLTIRVPVPVAGMVSRENAKRGAQRGVFVQTGEWRRRAVTVSLGETMKVNLPLSWAKTRTVYLPSLTYCDSLSMLLFTAMYPVSLSILSHLTVSLCRPYLKTRRNRVEHTYCGCMIIKCMSILYVL